MVLFGKSPYKELKPADLNALLEKGAALVVDVREPDEFSQGHIPGSINLPLSSFSPTELPDSQGKLLVLNCLGGKRSGLALDRCGAAESAVDTHLAGGFGAWAQPACRSNADNLVAQALGDGIMAQRQRRIAIAAALLPLALPLALAGCGGGEQEAAANAPARARASQCNWPPHPTGRMSAPRSPPSIRRRCWRGFPASSLRSASSRAIWLRKGQVIGRIVDSQLGYQTGAYGAQAAAAQAQAAQARLSWRG